MTRKEMTAHLDWMLKLSIIDTKEYMRLLLKSLPYVKG